jgi:hypothetical protein
LTNLYVNRHRWVAAALGMVLLVAGVVLAQDKLTELRLPLGYYPDGTLKAELRAADAKIQSETRFKGREVKYRSYQPNGALNVSLDASDAIVNRETMTASSKGAIKLAKDGVEITGVGFDWYGEQEVVKIKSKARVAFQRGKLGAFTPEFGKKKKQGKQ